MAFCWHCTWPWTGELRERMCGTLHSGTGRSPTGWSAHTDCNDLWSFGRLVCVTEIPRTAARTEEMETASYRKLKARRTLLLQYLLQQYRSLTGEDKPVSDGKEMEKCGAMPLLTESTLMMRIGPLVLIFGLREFVTVVYGPVVTHVFPDVQVEAYRHSVCMLISCQWWIAPC